MSTNRRAPSSIGSVVAQAGTRALGEAQLHNQRQGTTQTQGQSAYHTLNSQTTAGNATQNQTYSPLEQWEKAKRKDDPWAIVNYTGSYSTRNGQQNQGQGKNT